MDTPSAARCTTPDSMSWFITVRARLIGMANPRPSEPGARMTAVLIPITRPRESSRGPPEFPGLMAASVWMS